MSADRETVLAARAGRARALGLCGERFGNLGVCTEPAGHRPIAPPHWMHAADVDDGPLGDLLAELRAVGSPCEKCGGGNPLDGDDPVCRCGSEWARGA